jgi:hypothetical protein
MQTLELFKLNNYLIRNIPQSKQVLDKIYLNGDNRDYVQIENNINSSDESIVFIDDLNDSDFDIDNVHNNHNQSESELEKASNTDRLRPLRRKAAKTGPESDRYLRHKRKSNQKMAQNQSFSEKESDDNSNDETFSNRKKKDSILDAYGRGKRLTRSAAKRNRNEDQSEDDSVISISPVVLRLRI